MNKMLTAAQAAKMEIAQLTTEQKDAALLAMAQALIDNADRILAANARDMEAAKGTVSDVMLDRLQLTEARIAGMAEGIRQVAKLPDPVGKVLEEYVRADGLVIRK
ncbi:MAG: gamma-glutamyl-phosphate reductase, partial [Oscillospiraceae bacterium]|nr:gamma-glutamyl-phosphate reductase [Oscillospiraceae bacterium]